MSVRFEARCCLQQLVVEPEQQGILLDAVADVHRQLFDQTVDFGAHGDLLGGGDLAGGIDGKVDVAQFDHRGGRALRSGGGGSGFLPVLPAVVAADSYAEDHYQDDELFH